MTHGVRRESGHVPGAVLPDFPQTAPGDEHNHRLVQQVHPPRWRNPESSRPYQLVVIGAGPAGLVAASIAASLGARVALVERGLMGGDCLNAGCVPSKALLACAKVAATLRCAGQYGIDLRGEVDVNFAAVMERLRRLRADLSRHDAAARFQQMGVDVFLGTARFTGTNTLEVDGQRLTFRKAIVATGTRPAIPAIPGLDQVPYLTNETVFSLTERPRRLAVIGAGPIGSEMAQAFARLGSQVVLVESAHGVLPREERDAAAIVQKAMEADGVRLWCCARGVSLARHNGSIQLHAVSHDREYTESFDALLVATGRTPNVESLQLEEAGIEYDLRRGIHVDDYLVTTNRRVLAAGDVCSPLRFTHAADFQARLAVRNALFPGKASARHLVVPWCTYTEPEIAHVGLYPAEAEEQGMALESYEVPLEELDRAVLEGHTEGLVRVHVRKGTDRLAGATVVAPHAGELILPLTLALTHKLGLKSLAGTIAPYPTWGEAVRKTGDRYQRTRLTPTLQWALKLWMRWFV